ncbi:hypothetical protein VTK73DRAFT_2708 [Phialemonium thermophilum]|uniref:Uncharacterized protein n=1 Tax=Phialemonium thermophilum TaxID=223376 RepID=A0ABR3VPN9_9PEZI
MKSRLGRPVIGKHETWGSRHHDGWGPPAGAGYKVVESSDVCSPPNRESPNCSDPGWAFGMVLVEAVCSGVYWSRLGKGDEVWAHGAEGARPRLAAQTPPSLDEALSHRRSARHELLAKGEGTHAFPVMRRQAWIRSARAVSCALIVSHAIYSRCPGLLLQSLLLLFPPVFTHSNF